MITHQVCKPTSAINIAEDIVATARRIDAISARHQEDEVQREAELGAQRFGPKISSLDLLGQPQKEVPWVQCRQDAFRERAAAYEARHPVGVALRFWFVM